MTDYTIVNLGDVENVAPKFEMPEGIGPEGTLTAGGWPTALRADDQDLGIDLVADAELLAGRPRRDHAGRVRRADQRGERR